MSVVKSKRGEGQLLVITKANELATYTIKICSNEKNFPKHYRWCITSKIVDAAIEISNYANYGIRVKTESEKDTVVSDNSAYPLFRFQFSVDCDRQGGYETSPGENLPRAKKTP